MTFKRLKDVVAFIESNPDIDTVRYSAMPGLSANAVYVALYGHKKKDDTADYGGFGGSTLSLADFQKLQELFGEKLRFDCTGEFPMVGKES